MLRCFYLCIFALQPTVMAVGNFVAQAPVVDMANNVSGKTVQRPVLPKGIMPSITTTTDTTMPPAFPPPPYEQHGNRGERKSRKGQGQNAVSVATVAAYQQVRSFSTVRMLYWSDCCATTVVTLSMLCSPIYDLPKGHETQY